MNAETVAEILSAIDAGLVHGSVAADLPGQTALWGAIRSVSRSTRIAEPLVRLSVRLNDAYWSSTAERAKGLRRLAIAQLDSGKSFDDAEFGRRVIDLLAGEIVPVALRSVSLLGAADLCERERTVESIKDARVVLQSQPDSYATRHAVDSCTFALGTVADVALAVDAAEMAAAADAFMRNAGRDAVLARFAEGVVQILIGMRAPGRRWLGMTTGG
jgi:hypothetical protein